VSGGLLIDKPAGWTSHDVVAVVRRQLGVRAVGHTGTLDPFATGLLVMVVGRATRLARFAEGLEKRYRATVRFGSATDTDDATGQVVAQRELTDWPDRETIAAAVGAMAGSHWQRPPTYSAKHVAGGRSYQLARRGEPVELAPVLIDVHALDVGEWSPPDLTLEATVGRGTYLRALARDLGEQLGIPAHCAELRRLAVGPFSVDDAVTPEQVDLDRLLSPAVLLPGLPVETLDGAAVREIGFGRRVAQQAVTEGQGALLASDGRLVAVAEGCNGWWQPVVVLEPAA
jgi:tRNA pseudouridine55 synthase